MTLTMASKVCRASYISSPDHLRETKKKRSSYKDLNLVRNRQRTKTPLTLLQHRVHHEDLY